MLRKLGKIVLWIILVLLVLILIFLVGFRLVASRSFPRIDGEVTLQGLDAPVEIYRDPSGVPHIYATTSHDLFFAEGYVHAQDRFYQMDFWRHLGSARLSEMFGSGQVDTDKFLRTLGWARIVEEELKTADPTSLEILQSYADGVNAYLADHQGSSLSLEYAILKLTNSSYRPEPWTPLNTLTWSKAMAFDLGGNMDSEITRAVLLKTLTPEQLAEIVPPYPSDMPVILPSFTPNASSPSLPQVTSTQVDSIQAVLPLLTGLQDRLATLPAVLGNRSSGIGSNNWVISGELTTTGKPFLANDPHLAAQMPAIWYEVGLHCVEKGEACPYDVTGFSFAGAPGVIIGHNDRIVWGFTNVGPDVQDLYIEKINPDNPNQYEVNGTWQDMQLVQETIQVAGGDPVDLTVRYTRHGPIISDTYLDPDFRDQVGIDLPENYAISLRWTALEPWYAFRAIWKFNRAQSWEEFYAAAADFAGPSQNLVFADVDGNIGYQTPGNIPIRANGDGTLPVPGWTDEYEWSGYIPFDQLPNAFNPTEGYVVTANNPVVSSDYPYFLSVEWDYGYRAKRIVELIENAPGPIDSAYIQEIQGDNMAPMAEVLTPYLNNLILANDDQEAARQMLLEWDGQATMDSAPAALFETFWKNLLAITFQDDLPKEYWPDGGSRWVTVVSNLLDQPDNWWWDSKATSPVETRDQILMEAFATTVNELTGAGTKDLSKTTWGDLHTLTLTNQTLGVSGIAPIEAIFNRGPFPTSGDSNNINATGWNAAAESPYVVRSLPSMRMIVDLQDLNKSLAIHTTGESGHAYHPHYYDMTDLWRTIQYLPMFWDRDQVEANAEGHLSLLPAQ